MRPNDTAPATRLSVLFGTITGFDANRGFGYMNGDDGKTYYVHIGARRPVLQYGTKGRRRLKQDLQVTFGPPTNERIDPSPGDRLMFHAVPPRNLGKYPKAYRWGFVPDGVLTEEI